MNCPSCDADTVLFVEPFERFWNVGDVDENAEVIEVEGGDFESSGSAHLLCLSCHHTWAPPVPVVESGNTDFVLYDPRETP